MASAVTVRRGGASHSKRRMACPAHPTPPAHPALAGVDGYILGMTRFSIQFARDGVTTAGGFCCANTLTEARQSYPDLDLIYLPESSANIGADIIPPLVGVQGYIIRNPDGKYRIDPAIDGALTGEAPTCCFTTVQEARDNDPNRNLAWLRP